MNTQTHSLATATATPVSSRPQHQRGTVEDIDIRKPLKLAANQKAEWLNYQGDGISFDEAAEVILTADKEDGERSDLGIARLDTYMFWPTKEGVAALATAPAPGREERIIPLREHAFGQLCQRSGAPTRYIKGLPAKLQMACLNHGIQAEASKNGNKLRLAGGEARALVSDRYAALDNHVIIEVLRKTLQAARMLNDVRVRAVACGPTASMRMTLPGQQVALKTRAEVGDIVEIGFDLLNGELGNRSVSLSPVTYRLVCLNGMRSADRSDQTRLSHIGDPERLEEAFRDAVPASIASAVGMRDVMQQAVDVMVDDILSEFTGLSSFGLHKSESKEVLADVLAERKIALPESTDDWGDAFAKLGELSAFDVAQGITHVAQSRDTDRRLEMEEGAHAYLRRRTR